MLRILLLSVTLGLTGCASMMPADSNAQAEFTYDYVIDGVDQDTLFIRARDYFATAYGDSRSVFRVQDQESATIIGRGSSSWYIATTRCSSEYDIRFMSKDGKARLQLELLRGIPSYSQCGWDWPTKTGYDTIVSGFNDLADSLEKALSEESSFTDF